MAANLTHALALAARGFRVFPVMPQTKRPAEGFLWTRWATTDEATIRSWYEGDYADHGVAVAGGNGLVILDADVKDGQPGLRSLELIEMMGAELGFLVTTPSGGQHAYFRATDGRSTPSSVKQLAEFPGIDVRADGGYVVAPGTPGYDILADRPTPEAPTWLLDALRYTKKVRERNDGNPLIELDTEPNIQRAIAYLRDSAPEAVEGSGGNDTTFRVLARVKDFGISEHLAVDLLLAHWNEAKASPPWQPDEIERIAANVYAYGTGAPGKASALAEFEVVELEVTDGDVKDRFADPGDFIGADPPVREWVVEGCLPRKQVTLLYGDGGLGKTLLAQQLATSMALNREWMGRKTSGGLTLCVFSEDDTDEIWRRQIDINRSANTDLQALSGKIKFWTADHVADTGCVLMNFSNQHPSGHLAPFFRRLDAAVEALKPALVILDPIANMFGGVENDRAQVTGFVNRTLKRLCLKHDTTVLALAHPSVSGMATGSGLSGSTGWNNAVRSRLYLKSPKVDPTGDYRELEGMKANYGKRGRVALLKWSQGAFVVADGTLGDPELAADRSLLSALIVLTDRGEALSNSSRASNYAVRRAMALPECNGLDRSALEAALERLTRRGMVRMGTRIDDKRRERAYLIVEAAEMQEQNDDELE